MGHITWRIIDELSKTYPIIIFDPYKISETIAELAELENGELLYVWGCNKERIYPQNYGTWV